MSHEPIHHEVILKDGRRCIVRTTVVDDAETMHALVDAVLAAGVGTVALPGEASPVERVREKIERMVDAEEGCMVVAEVDGVLVGEGSLGRVKPLPLRHNATLGIGVHPDAQGIGVGRAIMDVLLTFARATASMPGVTPIERIDLGVLAENTRALRLYESMGFEREGLRRGYKREADGTLRDDVMMALWVERGT